MYGHVSVGSFVQSCGAASRKYVWKVLVVPDLSERHTGVMARFGNLAAMLGFSAMIAGSFQREMLPLKILARVAGDNCM